MIINVCSSLRDACSYYRLISPSKWSSVTLIGPGLALTLVMVPGP